MGGSRKLEMRIVSAENLPDRFLMAAYAKVSVDGMTRKTITDWEGDNNPTWNSDFVFDIKESYLDQGGSDILVNIYDTRILGDKFLGQVKIAVKNLFKQRQLEAYKTLTYPISGTPYGRLNIRYCFENKFTTRLILPAAAPPPPPPPPPRRKPVVTEMNLTYRTTEYLFDV